ncbi:trypsin inhibitor 1-like [Capsicum annuum]
MEKLTLVVAFLLLSSIFIQPLTAQSSCKGVKKDTWPELLGVPAKLARGIIQKENRKLTNVSNVLNGSPVTKDFRCDRVRLFVNVLGGTKLESLEIKHFVLVHGGSFGAWCWYETTTLLKETGYQVDAVDLTGSGAHYFDFNNIITFSKYVKPLTNFIENLPDGRKVILVGHDIGGNCVS